MGELLQKFPHTPSKLSNKGLLNIYIEGYVKAKKERDKIFMPRDRRSKEEKKRLRLYSMPFFAVSLFFFVAFVRSL